MAEVWEACRWSNQYVGILVALLVTWRLVPMVLDRGRWFVPPDRHRMLWFGYIAASSAATSYGAAFYEASNATAGPVSGVRVVLNVAAIALCVWWPHEVPTRRGSPKR